jgi:hypothetical protein
VIDRNAATHPHDKKNGQEDFFPVPTKFLNRLLIVSCLGPGRTVAFDHNLVSHSFGR